MYKLLPFIVASILLFSCSKKATTHRSPSPDSLRARDTTRETFRVGHKDYMPKNHSDDNTGKIDQKAIKKNQKKVNKFVMKRKREYMKRLYRQIAYSEATFAYFGHKRLPKEQRKKRKATRR